MAIQWDTLIASVAVATGGALLVEVIAKPWLEVRKDRLVRRARARDELVRDLFQLSGELGTASRWVASDTRDFASTLQGIQDKVVRLGNLDLAWLARTMHLLLLHALQGTGVSAMGAPGQLHLGGAMGLQGADEPFDGAWALRECCVTG